MKAGILERTKKTENYCSYRYALCWLKPKTMIHYFESNFHSYFKAKEEFLKIGGSLTPDRPELHDYLQSAVEKDNEKALKVLEKQKCKSCESVNTLRVYKKYTRYIIDSEEDIENPKEIELLVFVCTNEKCEQRYHTLMPVWLCPFLPYTYPFIAKVLTFYFDEGKKSINRTAAHFRLNRKTIRKFIKMYTASDLTLREIMENSSCQQLAAKTNNPLDLLKKILSNGQIFSSFLAEFCLLATHAFMAVKLHYSKDNRHFPYLFAPMGAKNRWDMGTGLILL